jgi:hypothetical protein
MPHLRLYVPQEWLADDFRIATGFDATRLLELLVQAVGNLRMDKPSFEDARNDAAGKPFPSEIPVVNLNNLKHAIIPMQSARVGADSSKYFLHVTLAAGNDTPGRTAEVRSRAAQVLGDEVDRFTAGLPGLASVTVHVQDIDRDRGYSTTAERGKTT